MSRNSPLTPKIAIIILAWNHVEDTLECLQSIAMVDTPQLEIVVVDNGSTDGTTEIISQRYPHTSVLRLDKNVGVSGGYNRGLEYALQRNPDYVMVLNNDTVVDPQFIHPMLETFQNNPGIGMVMPKIYHYYGEPGTLWSAGARWRSFPPSIKVIGANAEDGPGFTEELEIEYAQSCCLLIEAEALREIGLFDQAYYFYFDDWDLCERFRTAGRRIFFSPQAKIWHKVSLSTLKNDPPATWWRVMGESSVRFYLKHKSFGVLIMHTVWVMLRETLKLKPVHVAAYVAGVLSGIREQGKG